MLKQFVRGSLSEREHEAPGMFRLAILDENAYRCGAIAARLRGVTLAPATASFGGSDAIAILRPLAMPEIVQLLESGKPILVTNGDFLPHEAWQALTSRQIS